MKQRRFMKTIIYLVIGSMVLSTLFMAIGYFY